MTTTPSISGQWQDNAELNEIKGRRPIASDVARVASVSPAHTKKNPVQANPLSPSRATPQHLQRGIPPTRSRANHNDKDDPSGKSFSSKMQFIDTLLHEMDDHVS